MSSVQSSILTFLIAFGIIFVIFLIVRELMCWYWKINIIVKLLQSISFKLDIMNERAFKSTSTNIRCNSCGQEYLSDFQGQICKTCGERM